ncbi:MAG TPA: tetratricopeptide repeat protein, partial [Pyrinomonadaceae bacterium]|nr:tetratricopeptide repeat protein [Pyrinomonadaceae bacterium]
TSELAAAQTGGVTSGRHTTSSAEYVVGEVRKHKFVALGVLAALVVALAVAGYFRFFAARSAALDSVAVLPFQNGSNDANLDYLSDGLSESLIDKLSQLSHLKVIARSSSFKFRGVNIDVQDAANKLGVRAIITGRVVRRGDDLSIRVEMIDVRDNRQLWSEQYNRQAADALTIQQEIAQTVSEKLRLKLSGTEERQIAKQYTMNPQAYELLLKGRFARKGRRGDIEKSIEYFQQAVNVDPNYALAYFELSFSYNLMSDLDKEEATAQKALELDENLAEAHIALALVKQNDWNWREAESEFQRAIELNPNLARAHMLYSAYLSITGRHKQAIAEAKRGKELDPLAPRISVNYAFAYLEARQYDQGIEIAKKTFELDPNFGATHGALAYAYTGKGMYAEAIAEYQEQIRLEGGEPDGHIYLNAAFARAGQGEKARATLKRLETSKEYVTPVELAVLYTSLGEREQAFASLEKAYAAHDPELQNLKIELGFDSLRDEARFQDLLRRVGLPQ